MATVKDLRAQAKARKIKGYSRMSKAQLMSVLGVSEKSVRPKGDARARATAKKSGFAKSYAAQKLAEKLGGEHHKEAIVKAVSSELKKAERKAGRKLEPKEKRAIAAKTLKKYVQTAKTEATKQAKPASSTPKPKQRKGRSLDDIKREHLAEWAEFAGETVGDPEKPRLNVVPFKRKKRIPHKIAPFYTGKQGEILKQLHRQKKELSNLSQEANTKNIEYLAQGKDQHDRTRLENSYKGKIAKESARVAAMQKHQFERNHRRLVRVPKGTTQREYAEILDRITHGDKQAIKQFTIRKPKGHKTADDRRNARQRKQKGTRKRRNREA